MKALNSIKTKNTTNGWNKQGVCWSLAVLVCSTAWHAATGVRREIDLKCVHTVNTHGQLTCVRAWTTSNTSVALCHSGRCTRVHNNNIMASGHREKWKQTWKAIHIHKNWNIRLDKQFVNEKYTKFYTNRNVAPGIVADRFMIFPGIDHVAKSNFCCFYTGNTCT